MKILLFLFIYFFNITLSELIPKIETYKNGKVMKITYLKRVDNKLMKIKLENYFSSGQLESSVKFKDNQNTWRIYILLGKWKNVVKWLF